MLGPRVGRHLYGFYQRYCHLHTDAAKDIRNIALVAHIDSGKTTLTESVLLKSEYLSSPGSVDTGSTTTDFLPAERERGITIQSASIPVKWKNYTYNLIDTPGHADFGMEVESASRVVDGAIVLLDSVEGVEAQTKGVWRQLDRYNVPTRLMFLNKLDRPGASLHASVLSLLANRFHPQPVVLTVPVASFHPEDYDAAEPGIQGVVDLVDWELSTADGGRVPLPRTIEELSNGESSPFRPSHPLVPHLLPARTQLLDSLSMHSETFMSHLLALPSTPSAYLSVLPDIILPELRQATLQQSILPVVCGSALKHIGTDILLDYVGALLAGPHDIPSPKIAFKTQVQLLAWKVGWDKRKGWMTFVRVYSGTLSKNMTLYNINRGERERVSKLLLMYASEPKEVEDLPFGSVGVILGLRYTRTGDTLVTNMGSSGDILSVTSTLREIVPPPAVVSASIIPNSYSDLEPVQQALTFLTRTDPSARFEDQDGQLLLHGLGPLHLEIVSGRLRDEWNAQFQLGPRRVSYREGFAGPEIRDTRTYEMQLGGSTMWARIEMALRPCNEGEKGLPAWGDNIVMGKDGKLLPAPDALRDPFKPLSLIVQGLSSTLSNSHLTGLPHSNVHVTILSFELSDHTSKNILVAAAANILRQLLSETGMGPLLEPYVRIKVEVSEEVMGKVVKDLTEHRGEITDLGAGSIWGTNDEYNANPYPQEGLYVPPDWITPCSALSASSRGDATVRLNRSINALAPLSQMLDYSARLRAMTGGHGTFDMLSAGFREVNEQRKMEILKELGRA